MMTLSGTYYIIETQALQNSRVYDVASHQTNNWVTSLASDYSCGKLVHNNGTFGPIIIKSNNIR